MAKHEYEKVRVVVEKISGDNTEVREVEAIVSKQDLDVLFAPATQTVLTIARAGEKEATLKISSAA